MTYASKRSRAAVVRGVADWFALYRQVELSVAVYRGGASATWQIGGDGPDRRMVLVYMQANRNLTVVVDTGELMFRNRHGWASSTHMCPSKDIEPITGPGWENATVIEVVRAVHCLEVENMRYILDRVWEQCVEVDNRPWGQRDHSIPERGRPW